MIITGSTRIMKLTKGKCHKANVITSHVIHKLITIEDEIHSIKSWIFPHGNKDEKKENVMKYSATSQFDSIKLLLSLTTFYSMRLGVVDIGGAYMQIGPIKSDIFVRPPRNWMNKQKGDHLQFYQVTLCSERSWSKMGYSHGILADKHHGLQ